MNADNQALFQRAVTHFKAGEIEDARSLVRRILSINAVHMGAQNLATAIAIQEGEHETAIRTMIGAIRSDPRLAIYYENLGSILLKTGEQEWGLACLAAAFRLTNGKSKEVKQLVAAAGIIGPGEQGPHHIHVGCKLDKLIEFIQYKLRDEKLVHCRVQSIAGYCKERSLPYRTVLPERELEIHAPNYSYPCERIIAGRTVLPEAYVAELSDASIASHTGMLVGDDGTILNDIFSQPHFKSSADGKEHTYFSWADSTYERTAVSFSGNSRRTLLWRPGRRKAGPIDECISLVENADRSWANWLLQILPKIMLVEQFPEYDSLPFVVSDFAPRQALEALDRLNRGRRKVYVLSNDSNEYCSYRFRRIVYPSPMAHLFPGVKNRVRFDEHLVNPEGIRWLREKLLETVLLEGPRRRLYLSRARQKSRRLVNETETEALLKQHGFETVYPETLSFAGQLELYASAEAIVGVASSAMVNTMFSPADTKVILMVSSPDLVNCYPGATMLDMFGLRARYVQGTVNTTQGQAPGTGSEFVMGPGDLEVALSELDLA